MKSNTRKTAYAVVLVAIGVALGKVFVIPMGATKAFPAQHMVNVVGAVLLGPWWSVAIAAIIGFIRNAIGSGTVFAFPGGMIGALLAGLVYKYARNIYLAAAGEIVGTGIIAALLSGYVILPMLPESEAGSLTPIVLILLFLASTIVGSILGILTLKLLERVGFVQLGRSATAGEN